MTNDIAIAHKDYDVRGGGEVLAEELARAFDAPLIVGHRKEACEPENPCFDIQEIPLARWQRYAIDHGGAPRSLAYQFAWQSVPELREYDTIIMSGNEPLWYVPRDDQTVIAYTHSPPRYQYDLFQGQDHGLIQKLYGMAVRTMYESNVTRPDLYVANSERVARRINQYWNIPQDQIRVVYPPIPVTDYSPDDAPTEDFYLHLGRLAPAKRVDEIVEAFNQLGDEYPLKIAGTGPLLDDLQAQAQGNIEFLGYVNEQEKRELMSAARAHIYNPLNEDFGMVPVESMAAGTPVIGVREGFTEYQIQDGLNGYTYPREGGHLRETVRRFERHGVDWTPGQISGFARRYFSLGAFREGMQDAVQEAQSRSQITVPWDDTTTSGVDQPAITDGGPN